MQRKKAIIFFYKAEGSRAKDQAVVKTGNMAEHLRLYKTAISAVLASGGASMLDIIPWPELLRQAP